MTAETAYNVIQALSPEEKKRLMIMLNLTDSDKRQKPKISNSDAEIREMIITKFRNWRKGKA